MPISPGVYYDPINERLYLRTLNGQTGMIVDRFGKVVLRG